MTKLFKALLIVVLFAKCQTTPPNIIFILTDDQRWDALGYAGNNIIHTPEMDKLAKQGTYFKNAFVTTPICAASRASVFTGLYERAHGYTFGTGVIKEPFINNSYPALMKGSAYYTGFYGKFGVKYDSIKSLFDEVEVYDRNGKYKDKRGYFYKTIEKDTVHLTRYTGQKALDFIDSAPEDKPFCLSLSFSAPHAHDPALDQYFWQEEVDHLYDDIVISDPLMGDDEYFTAQPEYVKQGLNRQRWYWRYDTPEKYQHSVKGYYRMISGIDLEIGKIREKLKEKGLEDNTIIIVLGDNGHFLGERQFAGKWLMYDNSLRVPLIVYDPRTPIHKDVDELVLNIDIASTIFDFAGLPIPKTWQGESLVPRTVGAEQIQKREMFLCEHLWDIKKIPPSEGIRTTKWKYFRYRHDMQYEELYAIDDDPSEKNNLVNNPEYTKILSKLRHQCDSMINQASHININL